MLAVLSIIIGIVFVLLLFSMLTSAVVEVYHAFFASRGKHLRETMEIMLGKDMCDKFYAHSYFRQLSSATKPKSSKKLPIWMEKGTFSSVLADILTPPNSNLSIPERIALIENEDLRKVLDFLWRQSNNRVDVFQQKVESWFDDVMARAKDWFGDATKWRLFMIGVVLAGILNADTIQIYKSLSVNAALRDELVKNAETFVQSNPTVTGIDTSKTFEQAKQSLTISKDLYVQTVQSPLGLGWTDQGAIPADWWAWLIKIIGWVLTGVAVTLGAPFWYDMLRKLLSLKGSTGGGGNTGGGNNKPADDTPAFEMKAAKTDPTNQAAG
ncbi:MAG: hypothetical protein J0M29_10970 [Chitinophagales bacterium]|nr:hypothetical protein [Chitinophagales bacterium]